VPLNENRQEKASANVSLDDERVQRWNDRPIATGRAARYVVYWMQANRRAVDNPALELAVAEANRLGLPVVVYEALRPDYPFASDRLHRFVLEHARESAKRLARRGIAHGFFLPADREAARGVAAKVMSHAALVVSDTHPSFIFPRQNAAAAAAASCAYVTVDDNCIVPMARTGNHEVAARTIRSKLMKALDGFLHPTREISPKVRAGEMEWPFAPENLASLDLDAAVARCAIDHGVRPVADRVGGSDAARDQLASFLLGAGKKYDEGRSFAPKEWTSGLSPYLHFGAISARAVAMAARDALVGPARDAFLEQLVVRRGLAFNHAATEPRHAEWEAVPAWARASLLEHAGDPRREGKSEAELEAAQSGDAVWDAAQRELRVRGRMHNVLRMYWGKRLLELLPDPVTAFRFGVRMWDKYSLDGRDPNTYTGVGWCFGLHDQPFPERAIFGRVRPMGQGALKKRFQLGDYVRSVPARIE
jgi:deoxyribodipyrimidine photo-lyase